MTAVGLCNTDDRKESLRCPLCLDIYTTPKLLPCSHTFCEQCLQELVTRSALRGRFPCPSCRKETLVPHPGGVSAFQTNFYIDAQDLENARTGSFCETHSRQEMDWFCVDCNKILCVRCAITNHKSHVTEDLSARVTKAKTLMTKDVARLQCCIGDIRKRLTSLKEDQQSAMAKKAELVKTIRNKQAALKDAVDKMADEVVLSLETVTNAIWKEDHLQDVETELTQLHQRAQTALNCGVASRLMTVVSEVQKTRFITEGLHDVEKAQPTSIRRPVVRVSTGSAPVLNLLRKYMGTVADVEMPKVSAPEVTVLEQFKCGEHLDIRVFCVCPLSNGNVWVSYEQYGLSKNPPSQRFQQTGKFLRTSDRAAGKTSWTSRLCSVGVFLKNLAKSKQMKRTYSKSAFVYRLNSYFSNNSYVSKVDVLLKDPFIPHTERVLSINCLAHRTFDVDSRGQQFVVVEEAQAPSIYRRVLLFCSPWPDAVCTYNSPVEPFQPADVCFYTLGGHEVLLVADELNDAIHVVKATSSGLTFLRYLSPDCPVLVQPTALNTDTRGRLWVACRGGRILTCTSVSTADGTVPSDLVRLVFLLSEQKTLWPTSAALGLRTDANTTVYDTNTTAYDTNTTDSV